MHGIIILTQSTGDGRARVNRAPTVGNVMGAYRSLVANACLAVYQSKNETMEK